VATDDSEELIWKLLECVDGRLNIYIYISREVAYVFLATKMIQLREVADRTIFSRHCGHLPPENMVQR
jgi:hypothetical protein